jgi:hypothetical protein
VLGLGLLLVCPASRADPPPVEAFFANPRAISPRMSPSGKQFAVLVTRGDLQLVVLTRIGGKPEPIAKVDDPRLRFAWMEWESDDLLLLVASQKSP